MKKKNKTKNHGPQIAPFLEETPARNKTDTDTQQNMKDQKKQSKQKL